MPQVLRVVCCFQCRQFQSDIVKKVNKWTCSRCNTKQTLLKEYGRGSGQDCRLLAQELSTRRCETEDLLDRTLVEQLLEDNFELPYEEPVQFVAAQREDPGNSTSKWESFRLRDEPDDEIFGGKRLPHGEAWRKSEEVELDRYDEQQSAPLMNFQQGDRRYKLITRNTTISEEPSSSNTQQKTPRFFGFKPNTPSNLKQSSDQLELSKAVALKRVIDQENEQSDRDSIESNKMFKYDGNENANTRRSEITSSTSQATSTSNSASKWSRFVIKQDDGDL